MFSTKGQEVKAGGASKSLQPGVVKAHIISGQIKTSNKGDKKALEFTLEGPALDGFELPNVPVGPQVSPPSVDL